MMLLLVQIQIIKHSNENFRTKIFIVTDSRDNPVSSKPAKLLKIYTKQT